MLRGLFSLISFLLYSGNKRVVYDFGPDATEFPDGMTIDTSGNLWIACYGIGQIVNIDTTTGGHFFLSFVCNRLFSEITYYFSVTF